jgi:hypothetical protein
MAEGMIVRRGGGKYKDFSVKYESDEYNNGSNGSHRSWRFTNLDFTNNDYIFHGADITAGDTAYIYSVCLIYRDGECVERIIPTDISGNERYTVEANINEGTLYIESNYSSGVRIDAFILVALHK